MLHVENRFQNVVEAHIQNKKQFVYTQDSGFVMIKIKLELFCFQIKVV